ncbi:MAG TPA: cobyrinate a,c-diamide synthase [Thermobifida alba]|nr:cobyrinate a,c-diamide synthase [Thermobifida alba]
MSGDLPGDGPVTPLPRLVVAAPVSGSGKTTVATGLMAALRAAGYEVSGHKAGPDYIDPGYHALATGRPGRNLDVHLHGEELLAPLLLHGARTPRPADLAVVEGMMGLYDGRLAGRGFASTAHVATVLDAPVVLVVDVSHTSRSAAAVVAGMAVFDRRVRVAGVVLNRVGSDRHAAEVASAMEEIGVPVLGALRRDDGIAAPSRHLGLVPAQERAESAAVLDRLAERIAAQVDLAAVVEVARSAPPLRARAWSPEEALAAAGLPSASEQGDGPVVAVAGGRAFTFRYAETEELLRAAGCRPVVFDPTSEPALPDGTAGLYLGGGFPEVYAAELAQNTALRAALLEAVRSGVPTVAECAGLLYLCREVDGAPMVGVLDAVGAMTPKLALGYHSALAPEETLLAEAGDRVTGHEFHRTGVTSTGERAGPAWLLDGRPDGFSADPAGLGRPTLHASYLHTHWAGCPRAAVRFAAAVHAR